MLLRLKAAFAGGERDFGADANFYMHEAAEATLMNRGLAYEVAHPAVLAKYGTAQQALYHPEVIKQFAGWFSDSYRVFWGIIR